MQIMLIDTNDVILGATRVRLDIDGTCINYMSYNAYNKYYLKRMGYKSYTVAELVMWDYVPYDIKNVKTYRF